MEYTKREQELLTHWVTEKQSVKLGNKSTIVCLQMENGYEVIGTSACVNPECFVFEEGVYWATKDALKKVEGIVGYLKQSANHWF